MPDPTGGAFSTMAPGFMDDPYPAYAALREAAPLCWSESENAWLVSGFDEVAAVLSDPRFHVVELAEVVDSVARAAGRDLPDLRRILEAVLFLRNPPGHTEGRRFLAGVLNETPLARCAPLLEAVADELLDAAPGEAGFDAVKDYADLLPPRFMGRLLGLPGETTSTIVATVSEVTMCMDRGRSPRFYARVDATVAEGSALLLTEVRQRRRRPLDDGLSRMIARSDAGFGLTDQELAFRALFLLIAGIETTSALIGTAIKTILEAPGAAESLRAAPERIDAAVEEVLRLDGPAQLTNRVATQDLILGGQRVHEGDRLLLLLGAAHRDPRVYESPERFVIGRAGPPHLAFGRGLHHCLGAKLSRLEARVALARLLTLDPRPRPAVRYSWWPHRTLRRLESFPVSLHGPGIDRMAASLS